MMSLGIPVFQWFSYVIGPTSSYSSRSVPPTRPRPCLRQAGMPGMNVAGNHCMAVMHEEEKMK